MIKLAFSTNAFVRYSLESAIGRIADIGYDSVEILADKPHAFLPTISPKRRLGIVDLLRKHDLSVSNINVNTASGFFEEGVCDDPFEPSLASDDEKRRRWRIDYTKEAIEFASLVNSRNISITSGKKIPKDYGRTALRRFMDSLRELVKFASVRKIGIGLEYEPDLLVENADETLYIMNQLDSEYLGVNLDIGHCKVAGEDIRQVIRMFKGRIFNVHIYDIRGVEHYHLIPGEGDMDFLPIFRSLRSVGYDRFLTVELYTYARRPVYAARRALSYLGEVQKRRRGKRS